MSSKCGRALTVIFSLMMVGLSAAETSSTNSILLRAGDVTGPQIELIRRTNEIELLWPSALFSKENGKIRPSYEIQQSFDLVRWTTIKQIDGTIQDSVSAVRHAQLTFNTRAAFYRVVATSFLLEGGQRVATLGVGGAEVFGYGDLFDRELTAIGQITPAQFAALYPPPTNYVTQINFDPTKARFWAEFNAQPGSVTAALLTNFAMTTVCIGGDFRLNDVELAMFKTNGFVVSERRRGYSFADIYYRIWMSDLPVFITADSILQAWHRSYDMMLQEMEESYLFENLQQILDGMAGKIQEASTIVGAGVLRDSVGDADYLLTVGRSLLTGTVVQSQLGQDARVKRTLDAINALNLDSCFQLFGQKRAVDFSQFKVRGHYEETERLGRYFKCVMWLGRIDLRIAGKQIEDSACEPAHDADPRELGTALVLTRLLNDAGQFEKWRQLDQVIQVFVGWTDSLTFAQLGDVLAAAGVKSLTDIPDMAALRALQDAIESGRYGVQQIRSDYFIAPLGTRQLRLPRSFTIFGQKFVPDSWAFSKVVFDNILWRGAGGVEKVMRRVPSCLDIAFGVFGNDQTVPDLVQRITDQSPTRNIQRDGLPYQHNLAAVRRVMDAQDWEASGNSVYMDWLAALRALSRPLASEMKYPEVFRTRAWAMKTLNTQMASWTQLRHDTILYAKQSYTPTYICSFPDGYVEPVPSFWFRLRMMAERTQRLLANLNLEGKATIYQRYSFGPQPVQVDLKRIRQYQWEFLKGFADAVFRLEGIVAQEMAQAALSSEDLTFIGQMLEGNSSIGCAGVTRSFNGWYPRMFYRPLFATASFDTDYGVDKKDRLIADVHTDLPCEVCDPGDLGSVLHEAVGDVNLLMIAIPRGNENVIYAGAVSSHYEFEIRGVPTRWSDSEWKARLVTGTAALPEMRPSWRGVGNLRAPPLPPWTARYLVPSP